MSNEMPKLVDDNNDDGEKTQEREKELRKIQKECEERGEKYYSRYETEHSDDTGGRIHKLDLSKESRRGAGMTAKERIEQLRKRESEEN